MSAIVAIVPIVDVVSIVINLSILVADNAATVIVAKPT